MGDPGPFLARLYRLSAALLLPGAILALVVRGWPAAAGFLAGGAVGLVPFWTWQMAAPGIAPGRRRILIWTLMFLKYVLLGGAFFFLYRAWHVNLVSLAAGITVPGLAVLLLGLFAPGPDEKKTHDTD